MISNEEIIFFQEQLINWYNQNGRIFPWRRKTLNNYQKVIAEVLLQRTKAETVSKFYNSFLKKYPNWKSLAIANKFELENDLKPLGLYKQRASRLINLASEMVKRNGRFPKARKELESIPFIGQYIANSIELLIFKNPSPLLDVNMSRLIERYFESRKLSDIRYDSYLQNLSYRIANHKLSKEINWAILDFAALMCKARIPKCHICQINFKCNYYKSINYL